MTPHSNLRDVLVKKNFPNKSVNKFMKYSHQTTIFHLNEKIYKALCWAGGTQAEKSAKFGQNGLCEVGGKSG